MQTEDEIDDEIEPDENDSIDEKLTLNIEKIGKKI